MAPLYNKAEIIFGVMRDMPTELQDTLVRLVEVGEAGKNYNWVRQFNEGSYAKAADSLLVHREYMDTKKMGATTDLTETLDNANSVLIKYDGGFGDE